MGDATVVGDWVSALPFKIPLDLEEIIAHPTDPDREVEEGEEEVIGKLTPDQQIAWTIIDRFIEAAEKARIDDRHARTL